MNYYRPPHIVGLGGTLRQPSTSLFALERALEGAAQVGATTELLDLGALDLPIFVPGKSLDEQPPQVRKFIRIARRADGMIWSTAGYHGTLAGLTKNAIDYFEYLSGGARPYLHDKPVGLIATAAGDQAAVNAINAMVNAVHSLRGTALSLVVPIPRSHQVIDPAAGTIDTHWSGRLIKLGGLAAEKSAQAAPISLAQQASQVA